jgi:predicted Rossmann fold nucleotide-binding protein DprA/Smf involved in DNA uptake
MLQEYEILEIQPPAGVRPLSGGRFRNLWCLGEPTILNRRLFGIISARQIDSDLALKSADLLKPLGSLKEIAFIGGWHSPLEKEALKILLAEGASIVCCVSKSLGRFVPSAEVKHRVSQGEALLLTHCSPRAKRISREASMQRNELVMGLSTALLVLSAPAGSASLRLAQRALTKGKRILTPEHWVNSGLLAAGGLPATLENIIAALE